MKKLTISIVRALLCPIFKGFLLTLLIVSLMIIFNITRAVAQKITPLEMGDKIPAALWNEPLTDITNRTDRTIKLKHLKGTPIIIDFWASWCIPCIYNMPRLDSLSRANNLAFKPVMIVTKNKIDSLKDMRKFVSNFLSDKKEFKTSIVLYNPLVQAYFPHRVIPHYVWIGANGKVLAITSHKAMTPENIERFIAGKDIEATPKLK